MKSPEELIENIVLASRADRDTADDAKTLIGDIVGSGDTGAMDSLVAALRVKSRANRHLSSVLDSTVNLIKTAPKSKITVETIIPNKTLINRKNRMEYYRSMIKLMAPPEKE